MNLRQRVRAWWRRHNLDWWLSWPTLGWWRLWHCPTCEGLTHVAIEWDAVANELVVETCPSCHGTGRRWMRR